jgi:glutamate-1-semialdehyde aminotransferase
VALETRSELYRRALELIPGGVNSPVRAMRAVGLDEPFFVARGEGGIGTRDSSDGGLVGEDWRGPMI